MKPRKNPDKQFGSRKMKKQFLRNTKRALMRKVSGTIHAKDLGDNPKLRRGLDARQISTSEPWEIEWAKKKGEITIKNDMVHPVAGKTKVENGKIVRI